MANIKSFSMAKLAEDEVEALVKAGYYSSRSEVINDALRNLLETKKELRLAVSFVLYKNGRVSLGKAAEIAGLTTFEFKEFALESGIKRIIGPTSFDIKKAEKLLK